MHPDLSAEISALRKTVKAAAGNAFVPAAATMAMTQACAVIEVLVVELVAMQRLLDQHLVAHLSMGH